MKPISNLVNSIKSIKTGFTTDYLLESSNGYLLIDTGYPKDYDKFVKKLRKKYDLKISDIAFLLLTHHHDDHAGFASKIIDNSDALLITHKNALDYLKMGKIEDTSSPLNKRVKFVFYILNKFHKFTYPPVKLSGEDIILEGEGPYNEILRNIGIEGNIINSPGHTEDGISVILDNGFIFPGDNTMNLWSFNLLGIKKRPIVYQDMKLIYDSWRIYMNNGGKIIFPAHGKPFDIEKLNKFIDLKF